MEIAAGGQDGKRAQEEGAASDKQEELRAVLGFVVNDLKAELLVELLKSMKPRWG